MRRIGLALASALLASTVPSSATSVGPLGVAPFEQTAGNGGSGMALPCTIGSSPVGPIVPDPATGRIDAAIGVSVSNCDNHGVYRSDSWKVLDTPAPLIGMRGTVVASILVDGVQAVQTGTQGTRGATYKLKIADKEWVVMSVVCEDEGCAHSGNTLGPVMFPLGVTYNHLPASIVMTIWREAYVIGSEAHPIVSGSVGVDVKAKLVGVAIHTL